MNRAKTYAPHVVLAALLLGIIAALTPGSVDARQSATSPGGHTSCAVDAAGFCTVTHGLGYQPKGVVVTADRIGQLGTTDRFTASTFRVRWWWYEPTLFKPGTRISFSWVPAGVAVPPTVPPSSTPPTTVTPTPAPTTAPTTAPPAACPKGGEPSFVTTAGPGNYNGAETTWPDHTNSEKVYGTHNDLWNNDNGTYTMKACDYDNWYELATQPNTTDGSVKTYPKVKRDYCPGWVTGCDMDETILDVQMPLSRIESVRFAHNTERVPGMIWNVAFDVWINNALENELMIWTENMGQTPAGSRLANAVIGGKEYQVWKAGSGAGGIFTYVSVVPQTSGVMPLGLFFDDLKRRGWLKPKAGQTTDTTWQLNYGVEIVDTNNTEHRFNFTDFAITEN
jgi:hypothetical protein